MSTRDENVPVSAASGARHPDHPGPLWVAGIGCRRGCGADMIRALLSGALSECGLDFADLAMLASIEGKDREPGLRELADELGLTVSVWPAEVLQRFDDRLGVRSERVLAATGCNGVAESAALAAASGDDHADRSVRLVLRRRSNARATVAIAQRGRNE